MSPGGKENPQKCAGTKYSQSGNNDLYYHEEKGDSHP